MTNIFFGGDTEGFLNAMNSFFDLDQIVLIERSCAHYVFNLICCRRLFEFLILATKSHGGANMTIFEQN